MASVKSLTKTFSRILLIICTSSTHQFNFFFKRKIVRCHIFLQKGVKNEAVKKSLSVYDAAFERNLELFESENQRKRNNTEKMTSKNTARIIINYENSIQVNLLYSSHSSKWFNLKMGKKGTIRGNQGIK